MTDGLLELSSVGKAQGEAGSGSHFGIEFREAFSSAVALAPLFGRQCVSRNESGAEATAVHTLARELETSLDSNPQFEAPK